MKNIFEKAKFGDHFTFDGDDCIFLQQISEPNEEDGSCALYELAVHKHINFTDGSQKDYVRNIRVHPDGFAYAVDEEDGSAVKLYVTQPDDYEKQLDEIIPSRHDVQDYLEEEGYIDENGNFIDYVEAAVQIGYRWGYSAANKK